MKWEKWVQQSIWRKKGGETITLCLWQEALKFWTSHFHERTLDIVFRNTLFHFYNWMFDYHTDNSILSHHLDKTFPHWEDLKSFESKSLYFEWPLSYYKVCLFATLWNLLSVSSYTERTIHRCHSGPAYKWHYCQRAWQPNRYNYKSLYDCCFRYL